MSAETAPTDANPVLTAELRAVVASTRGLLQAAACSCALASADGASMRFVAADGAGAEEITGVELPVGRGIVGFVALSGQPIAVGDVSRDDRFARDIAEATRYVPRSILAAPMLDQDGEVLGVLEVLDATDDEETRLGGQLGTAAQLAALTVVASQAAAVVRLARRLAPTEDRLDDVLAGLDATDERVVVEVLSAVLDRLRAR